VGHVAHKESIRIIYNILVGTPKGKILMEDLGGDGRMSLKWISEE
jgi:hypothetical protein